MPHPIWQRVTEPKQPCVYILAKRKHGALYIGVTSNLTKRLYEHRTGAVPGHAKRHSIKCLVHFEQFEDMPSAIAREKQLKNWHRDWKCNLIERDNPDWHDIAADWRFDPV
ncbi:GIY-YIG nuclease family protein [uncultured Parasphingopyxis sp.]|uniref:GIY-YIG nuclease family protein n=1 Tax=uncultured Parasphingopyxis sp. TaxID=1547918 RepID=UPI002625CE8D|nr:GIY-YIG nuclease family protein [uncultured Parasphingopyxis sp.]